MPQSSVLPRLLFLDIETSPSCVWTWDFWGANISADKVIEPSEMIAFAAGWHDCDEIEFYSVHHNDKETMVRQAHRLLDEATWVCHYNGLRFDMPKLYHEFLVLGLPPPSPVKNIDLIKTVKKFSFTHNSLANVLKVLGMDQQKMDHGEGFSLWLRCMAGEDEAWDTMRTYNIQDVNVLKGLYAKLLPWINPHPSMAVVTGHQVCVSCGSANYMKRGFTFTNAGKFQQYQCKDCKHWFRDTKRIAGSTFANIAA